MTIKGDLKSLVTSVVPVYRGTVESKTETTIIVSSKAGRKEFQVADVTQYQLGDTVKFQGNSFLGKIPAASGNVYVV